jgi:hypothetical protein
MPTLNNLYRASNIGGGLSNILGGIFSNPSKAYENAGNEYEKYYNQSQGYQEPYYNAGKEAIGGYQDWLHGMENPSEFINKQMGSYNESPYAHYLQQNALRSAQNLGSSNGLSGSTPMMQFMQQNANNIASGDINDWLQNVLGINSQYGAGLNNLMGYGQNASNTMSQNAMNQGQRMGDVAYNQQAAKDQRMGNIIGGAGSLLSGFLMPHL